MFTVGNLQNIFMEQEHAFVVQGHNCFCMV